MRIKMELIQETKLYTKKTLTYGRMLPMAIIWK
jgi:hypothetical protein